MEHALLSTIVRASFTPFGWFEPSPDDRVPQAAKFVILVGNAGPAMFRRFQRERTSGQSLDDWTRATVDKLAAGLDATPVYPFDKPPLPFLTWARKAGAGYVSPLGLNIHPQFGLWHAFRAALLFPVTFDLPPASAGVHPCESCTAKPCLTACPVNAFVNLSYDVTACGKHVLSESGHDCMTTGCKARLACPIGRSFTYEPMQMQFHMDAFQLARKQA
jgi:epoxyqueuosine reductase QueG